MSRPQTKRKKKMIGLEIGSSGIKLAVGEFGKDTLEIKKVITNPLPENVYNDGEIANIELVVNMLKQLIRTNKIKTKDCMCCMNSGQIISREVTIPSNNKEHLTDMAKYEVEQFLPVEMDNYTVQSIILREIEVEEKPFAEMLVTAFPKKLIAQMHELISRSGLKPYSLDTQANAFAKLIENQQRINGNDYHRDGVAAFIDLGYENITIQIFKKGKFGFSQIVPFGGRDLDTNISKFLDISIEDAQMKKMQIKNLNYTVDELSEEAKLVNVIKSTLTTWLDEINKIFRYYRSRNTGAQGIEYIYIYGGLSNMPGITDFIESKFKVPTEKVKKISSVDVPTTNDVSEIMNTIGVFYRR